jgi:hypothetical protein
MERSEIRVTLAAPVSGRTQKKDSFAAPKTLPFNDFLHFAQCGQLRDLTVGPPCGSTSWRCVGTSNASR